MRTTSIFQRWRCGAMALAGTALLALPVAGQAQDSTSGVTANGAFLFWEKSNWSTVKEPSCFVDGAGNLQIADGLEKRTVTCKARWMSGTQPDETLGFDKCVNTLEAGDENSAPADQRTTPINPVKPANYCPPPKWEWPSGWNTASRSTVRTYNAKSCGNNVPVMREYKETKTPSCSDGYTDAQCERFFGDKPVETRTYTKQIGTKNLQPCKLPAASVPLRKGDRLFFITAGYYQTYRYSEPVYWLDQGGVTRTPKGVKTINRTESEVLSNYRKAKSHGWENPYSYSQLADVTIPLSRSGYAAWRDGSPYFGTMASSGLFSYLGNTEGRSHHLISNYGRGTPEWGPFYTPSGVIESPWVPGVYIPTEENAYFKVSEITQRPNHALNDKAVRSMTYSVHTEARNIMDNIKRDEIYCEYRSQKTTYKYKGQECLTLASRVSDTRVATLKNKHMSWSSCSNYFTNAECARRLMPKNDVRGPEKAVYSANVPRKLYWQTESSTGYKVRKCNSRLPSGVCDKIYLGNQWSFSSGSYNGDTDIRLTYRPIMYQHEVLLLY